MKRVAVLGAGITGLAAAHRVHELASKGGLEVELLLLEAGPRVGGTIRTRVQKGFVLEEGPDSILTEKPWAVQLARRLGLESRLVGTQEENRKSFVVRGGRLRPIPEGFYLLAPTRFLPLITSRLFSPLGIARMSLDLVLPRRRSDGDESVGSFVTRRLGREALDRMAQPMVAGIYGADPMKLSLQATFPRFLEMEREHGSVIRGMWAAARKRRSQGGGARYELFVTFDRGLQVLVDELRLSLPHGSLRTGHPVEQLRKEAGRWRFDCPDAQERVDAVIAALPGHAAAALIRPLDPILADRIESIPYGPAATVSLAYREADVAHPMNGFGFVVPEIEGMSIHGCTFCHRKYPGRAPEGHALLRAFHGARTSSLSDDELLEVTRRELTGLLGIRGDPILGHVSRYPHSMPQYPVGQPKIREEIRERLKTHPGLALAGNAYLGVGLPDCILSGEKAAEETIARLYPGA
jgi:protoporphyrinogen/coproporphyrinogen III oxidase